MSRRPEDPQSTGLLFDVIGAAGLILAVVVSYWVGGLFGL